MCLVFHYLKAFVNSLRFNQEKKNESKLGTLGLVEIQLVKDVWEWQSGFDVNQPYSGPASFKLLDQNLKSVQVKSSLLHETADLLLGYCDFEA